VAEPDPAMPARRRAGGAGQCAPERTLAGQGAARPAASPWWRRRRKPTRCASASWARPM
jgi:hypothetical protein